MSAKTKTFLQQDHSSKRSSRDWSYQRDPRKVLAETSHNTVPPKPPIELESQNKTKLKSFQHHTETSITELNDGPSHSYPVEQAGDIQGDNATSTSNSPKDSNAQTPALPSANAFPSTPAVRLSIEELISGCDRPKPEPRQESPEEQIGWIPNSSNTLLTPNRRRKRARSSSPSCPTTSSQRNEASHFFTGDLAGTEDETPNADPAAELWQRFKASKKGDNTLKLPDISHLIFQASPRPLETPAKTAGFRRWASTGNDWPSSRRKRPRTGGRHGTMLYEDRTADNEVHAAGGKSKVATLVEKLQESLATQKLGQPKGRAASNMDEPSSSSPLPESGSRRHNSMPSGSPLRPRHQMQRRHYASAPGETSAPVSARAQSPSPNDGESDARYRQVAAFQDSINSAPLHLQSKAPLPAFKRPSWSRTSSHGLQHLQAPTSQSPISLVEEDTDEFGDDLDFSVEDLEELVSQAPPSHLEHRELYDIPEAKSDENEQQHSQADAAAYTIPPLEDPDLVAAFDDNDDDDEYGDDDIDEDSFALAEFTATQAAMKTGISAGQEQISHTPTSSNCQQRRSQAALQTTCLPPSNRHGRLLVQQIIHAEFSNDKGQRLPEQIVLTEDQGTKLPATLTLRGSWLSTMLAPGDIVHVSNYLQRPINCNGPAGQLMVDDTATSPLLVVHPDHMLSATTVADSFDCVRKAVLQDRIKATSEMNKPMIYGKILHEVFQQAMLANTWTSDFLFELVEKTVQSHIEGLWELGMRDDVLAIEEVKTKMSELACWAAVFVAAEPGSEALVDDKLGNKVQISISKLIAIEEHVWAPRFGLKGNIDATVQTSMVDGLSAEPTYKRLITPFEVKTGRTTQSPAHRAQTALYTLLLSDRYDVEVKAGILYYLESSGMSRIAPPINEIRQMMQQRNRLANLVHNARHPKELNGRHAAQDHANAFDRESESPGLPVMLKNPFKCGRCYAKDACFAYHALVEGGDADTAGMVDDGKKDHSLAWREAVGHLVGRLGKDHDETSIIKRWFTKWDKLLTFEESEMSQYRREIWTMSSAQREAVGRCFGNLVISQDLTSTAAATRSTIVDGIEGGGGKINRFIYTFTRSDCTNPFTDGTQLTIGEPIVISSEQSQWALANGYIISLSKHEIMVAVDRKLGEARQRLSTFNAVSNQTFRGVMSVEKDSCGTTDLSSKPQLYRLDKDEFSNGLALVRNSLVTLMSTHPIHTKLRNQIIFDESPTVTREPPPPLSRMDEMNDDQQAAVNKVMSAQDYALILGMPGTGKTTTIAHIIRALVEEDKSVLLTSFTHTAVDNILLKLKDAVPMHSILRLGVPAKINPQVQTFCQLAATPRENIAEIDEAYMNTKIVATTCMGTNHALFRRRSFDVCIVDEASQITLPVSLGPLLHARRFVLVGDHYQLPPLVQNRLAQDRGLDMSLFRQLSERHPVAVATLGRQYRMNEDIMTLSNELIYNGQLRCGNEDVAERRLHLPDCQGLYQLHMLSGNCKTPGAQCWLSNLTNPHRPVVFASTDALGSDALESLSAGSKNITNVCEATLTAQLVTGFLAQGVTAKDIGVITLYRSQITLLRRLFKRANISSEIDIDSADRFQGRDKECIVLSMVRANDAGIVGDLLKDWRRVNVALTRAKSKLVILGHRQTLRENELLARFITLVETKKWVHKLMPGDDTCHDFDHGSQGALEVIRKADGTTTSQLKATSRANSPIRAVLVPSQSSCNNILPRGAPSDQKRPGKVVKGSSSQRMTSGRKLKEQLAFEILEDIVLDDV